MNKLLKYLSEYYFHILALIIIGLLSYVNFHQKVELKTQETELGFLSDAINYSYSLLPISGNKIPFEEEIRNIGDVGVGENGKILAMIANFRVCSTCLRDELEILNKYHDRMAENGIQPIIIFGIKDKMEKEIILSYKKRNLIKYPYVSVDYEKLNNFIPLIYEDGYSFIENPQYLLLSESLRVINSFKPPKYKSEYLESWIEELI